MIDSEKELEYYKDRQTAAQNYNLELSKWILASLIVVNGGPFALLSKDGFAGLEPLRLSAMSFAIGLALSIICGFLAWLNAGMREYGYYLVVQRLMEGELELTKPTRRERNVSVIANTAFFISIIVGFASLAMFVSGAEKLTTIKVAHPAKSLTNPSESAP